MLACNSIMFEQSSCGLDASLCYPFETTDYTPIFCPPSCNTAYKVEKRLMPSLFQLVLHMFSPHLSFFSKVFGTGVYKADSFICTAAGHAGALDIRLGGTALMRFSGPRQYFEGSSSFGVHSKTFPSWFPRTVEFKSNSSATQPFWVDGYTGCWTLIGNTQVSHCS